MSKTREHFRASANETGRFLLGARWKAHARGVFEHDCLGLVILWYRMAGKTVDDPLSSRPGKVKKSLLETFERIDKLELDFGDLLEIDQGDLERPHLGIYVGKSNVINTVQGTGCHLMKLENIITPWHPYRLREVVEAMK